MDSFQTVDTIRWALRRSRARTGILLALLKLRAAHVADVSRVSGVEPRRVIAAIHGDGETYRFDGGLYFLGLVKEHAHAGRVVFALTPRGEQVAREVKRDLESDLRSRRRIRT